MAIKILKSKLWSLDAKPWKRNITEIDGEILVISQFTLYHSSKSNGSPSFHRAMNGTESRVLYDLLIDELKRSYSHTKVFNGNRVD